MTTAIERCACGKYVLERWCGTYADHLGSHTRERCSNDDSLVPLTPAEQVNDLLNAIDNAAGQTTDPMCREALCAVLKRYGRTLCPGPAGAGAPAATTPASDAVRCIIAQRVESLLRDASELLPVVASELRVGDETEGTQEGMSEKDRAYAQRNMLVGALSKLFPAWIATDPAEPDWPVVLIELPTGQVSWHVTKLERYSVFAHLETDLPGNRSGWDGHDDVEKWRRVCTLPSSVPGDEKGGRET